MNEGSTGHTVPDAAGFRWSVAPMMDWTDRHCRSFHRHLIPHGWLYSEMVNAQAVIHGDRDRLLALGDEGDGGVVLQLGGNDAGLLAQAARIGVSYGYDEINLNCGCPSDRVQAGQFGASLMAVPRHVADLFTAMQSAVQVPVTIKHRIGIDRIESYGFVEDFVGTLVQAGCRRFIVHARNAWLSGLSPKENREIPPLRYGIVRRLAAQFADVRFELNGGLVEAGQAVAESNGLHGAMLGRAAYHDPVVLATLPPLNPSAIGDGALDAIRARAVDRMHAYLRRHAARGVEVRQVARHMLGLYKGTPGARRWRQMLSDAEQLRRDDPDLLLRARDAVAGAGK